MMVWYFPKLFQTWWISDCKLFHRPFVGLEQSVTFIVKQNHRVVFSVVEFFGMGTLHMCIVCVTAMHTSDITTLCSREVARAPCMRLVTFCGWWRVIVLLREFSCGFLNYDEATEGGYVIAVVLVNIT